MNTDKRNSIEKVFDLVSDGIIPSEKLLAQAKEQCATEKNLLEKSFIAIARTGANYDTFNPLRPIWETIKKYYQR